MRYYKIQGEVSKVKYLSSQEFDSVSDYLGRRWFHNLVKQKTHEFNEPAYGDIFLSAVDIEDDRFMICAVSKTSIDLNAKVKYYLQEIGISVRKIAIREVTFETFKSLLRNADREDFIEDEDDILEEFELEEFSSNRIWFHTPTLNEFIFEPHANKVDDRKCNRLLTSADLKKEIDRIKLSMRTEPIYGHPVHYLVSTDDKSTLSKTYDILLNNLIKNGRSNSKRYCTLDCSKSREISETYLDAIFRMSHEGAIVASFQRIPSFDSDRINNTLSNIETFCECVKKHRNDVLTIFLLPKECTQVKNFIFEHLGTLSFVEINEVPANSKRARRFLTAMAKDNAISADEGLFSKIEADKTYFTGELRIMFEDWYSKKLRTDIYPQYSQFEQVKIEEAKKEAKGTAYDELMSMIGLDEAKKIISQAIDFNKMQKYLAAQNVNRERPSQHMVFTGNPGTAKTTVARLFAQIMRENDLLSSGHIVEVGRADLVGKFVGHTAPLVKSCFEKAKGGVLFIDEAYSLVDDRDGCFGDEAINTIVQEMENNRDNLVVIFAGYPNKMEQFLQKNPGLRSRIAFHVPFPDYTTEELCEIASLIASKKNIELSADAKNKLSAVFDKAREEDDFGNGRYVRSVIEKALMAQATRIVNQNFESLSRTELITLRAEDIELPECAKKPRLKLGFCA